MASFKHVGRIKSTNAKVLVVFRTLPGESNYSLVMPVANLSDDYHNSIMKLVETPEAQDAFEFGEIMFSRSFPDGRPMLRAMQADNILQRVATDNVTMSPSPGVEIELQQLNVLIAEQKNCAVDDLHTFVSGAPTKSTTVEEIVEVRDLGRDVGEPNIPQAQPLKAKPNEALSDKDIAKSYRSQADSMYKEAAKLRKDADELDPPVKKATKTSKVAADA